MKILFLLPYPLEESPSQRFRFEQYTEILLEKGHELTFQSFLDSHTWRLFFNAGKTMAKAGVLLRGFLKRTSILLTAREADIVFIHREATSIGPPIFEWIIAKILRKKIVYDFDDAIWLTDRKAENFFLRIAKWRSKVASICRWSYTISCGNSYLADYAKQFNQQVVINPTTIDTINLHKPEVIKKKSSQNITIGWTGSHSTLKYLNDIEPILKQLEEKFSHVRFLIIADKPPSLTLRSLTFISWSRQSEIDDLLTFDIGIMPLPNDEWSNGKCGFKALQYMALEIPTVASAVGVNNEIIDHGVNGFLCSTDEDWMTILEKLITDVELRRSIGRKGREKIIESYSVISNSSLFLSLFE